MIKCCLACVYFISLISGAVMTSTAVWSDPVLMQYEDYMEHCMNTEAEVEATESICDMQYTAIVKKELSLTAQADAPSTNTIELEQ